jgi:hypothetical protein
MRFLVTGLIGFFTLMLCAAALGIVLARAEGTVCKRLRGAENILCKNPDGKRIVLPDNCDVHRGGCYAVVTEVGCGGGRASSLLPV